MFFLWALLVLIIALIAYVVHTLHRDANYFEDREILYMGNGIINTFLMLYRGQSLVDVLCMRYDKLKSKNQTISGGIDFGKPTYFIIDLDLAKRILVKDFDHFVDRRPFVLKGESNKILSKMLLIQEGDTWKGLRTKMSPTFTTGKIRRMFNILDQSGKKMVKYLETEMLLSDGVVNLQEAHSKYTMDVIASVAVGLDSKAFEQRDHSNFEKMASMLQLKFSGLAMVKFLFIMLCPKLADNLGMALMPPVAMDFFSTVVKSAIKYREEKKEKREDFLQLMLDARTGQLKNDIDAAELTEYERDAIISTKSMKNKVQVELEENDIIAQSVLFIIGGYDMTQALLLFAAYNLAINPEIQQRVYQEVKKSVENNEGELTYDSVNSLEYLDMFVNETLRYYPPGIVVERMCTKPYKIPDTNVIIEKGQMVSVPIYPIQRDSAYFPDPLKFDPERFSPENKFKIHPCAFMPFGAGPRSCIAMRLALVEAKMAVAHLALNFLLEPTEKTPIPMKYTTTSALKPEGGMWLKIQSRNCVQDHM